jgi:hypothetical protein
MIDETQGIGIPVRNSFGVTSGLLIGGLIGTMATLLLAPRSGIMTRRQIWKQSRELRNEATGILANLVALTQYDGRKFPVSLRMHTDFETPESAKSRNTHVHQPNLSG